jgi:hypothetical protein
MTNLEPYWNTEVEECPTCQRHLDKCPCDTKGEQE